MDTAKLLKVGLVAVRQERAGLKAEVGRFACEISQLGNTGATIAAAQTVKVARQAALDTAKGELAKHLATYREYPPRQKPGSFSLDQVLEKLHEHAGGAK